MPRGAKDGSIRTCCVLRSRARHPTGEHWLVRKRYTDLKGRHREKQRIAFTATEAMRLYRKIEREIEAELAGVPKPNRTRTVRDLINHCKQHQFKPAVYAGDKKVAGQRTWRATWNALKPVEKYFGNMVATEVEHEDLADYKELRLRKPVVIKRVRYEVVNGKKQRVEFTDTRPRSMAGVDRELSWLRRVFSVALRKRWITEHPFHHGDGLIEAASENKRLRILSFPEERRLFTAFDAEARRAHLPFAVTMALETAMRKSEQFRLERADINLDGRLLTAISYKGRRAVRRSVPITEVLMPQLADHLASHSKSKVFAIADPKKAFTNACRDAGVEGVTWHTLRHTAITRMVHVYRIPPLDVMKISGHTVWKTFFETYVNLDDDMVRSIGAAIDSARAASAALVPLDPAVENVLNETVN